MKTKSKPGLAPGDRAPAFRLPDERGTIHDLKAYRGRWLVLFFYPRDLTPGCTQEACEFRDAYRWFQRQKVALLGISDDSATSHLKFKEEHRLPFPLLVDGEGRMAAAFGVWRRKMMFGRAYMGNERATFVINPEGLVALVFRQVKVEGHVEAVKHELAERLE